jgi:hypothetical protein
MDLHAFAYLDPDPHSLKKQDPDPLKVYAYLVPSMTASVHNAPNYFFAIFFLNYVQVFLRCRILFYKYC